MIVPKKYIFFLFLFLTSGLFAQDKKVDSLINVLESKGNKRDTARINLLYKIAFEYFQSGSEQSKVYLKETKELSDSLNYTLGKAKVNYLSGIFESQKSNYPESLKYFNESLRHYKAINDEKGQATIYSAFGITHIVQGEYEDALKRYKQAYDIFVKVGDKENTSIALMNMANVYTNIGDYDRACDIYEKLLKLYEEEKDERGIMSTLYNHGYILRIQGNYPVALDYFGRVLRFHENEGDTLKMATVLNTIGDTYRTFGRYMKAEEFHRKSLKFSRIKGDRKLEAINLTNIGNVFSNTDQLDSAEVYFTEALEISRKINDRKHIVADLLNLGQLYVSRKEYEQGDEYFLEALELSEQMNFPRGICIAKVGMAEIHLFKRNYSLAFSMVDQAKEIAKDLGLLDIQKKSYEILKKIHEGRGDFEKALYAYEQYKILSDSLINKEKIEKVAEIEYKYIYQHQLDSAKIRELKLSKIVMETNKSLKESEKKNLWAVISILCLIMIAGGVIFFLRIRNLNTKTQNVLVEQRLLRSQMTPHFVFNSLSVLQGMILNQENQKSVSYLSKFSKLLRLILENSRTKTVALHQELEAIESYLKLQSLEDDTCQYKLLINENVNKFEYLVPPMLIQPYIENSIEHAFRNHEGAKEVNIELTMENEDLICTIKDNGIGIDASTKNQNKNKKSLATTITAERINTLSKYFKTKGSVRIEDRKVSGQKGTLVTLVLPYIRNNE